MKKINKKLKFTPTRRLTRQDEVQVVALVDNPPAPNQKMKDAVRDSSIRKMDKLIELIQKEGIDIDPNVEFSKIGDTFEFKIKDKIYNVSYIISKIPGPEDSIFEFKFGLMNNPKFPKKSNFADDRQYQIAVQKSQIGITGTGDSKEVFNKVISIMVKIINDKRPDYITFHAEEKNRQRLYSMLIKHIVAKIKTYKQIDYNPTHNPLDNESLQVGEYWLKEVD